VTDKLNALVFLITGKQTLAKTVNRLRVKLDVNNRIEVLLLRCGNHLFQAYILCAKRERSIPHHLVYDRNIVSLSGVIKDQLLPLGSCVKAFPDQ